MIKSNAVWFLLVALVFLRGTPASALPPDERIHLPPGTERFLKAEFMVTGVAVDPADVVQVELMPSEELFVTVPEDAGGIATVLAVGVDRVHAWEICVSSRPARDCPKPAELARLKKACPDFAEGKEDGAKVLRATIRDDACYHALREVLEHSDVPPGRLRLVMEEAPARTFYTRVLDRIRADQATRGLSAAYYGATLKLSGKVPRRAVNRAVMHAYRETVGRVSFDDRTESPPGSGAEDKP